MIDGLTSPPAPPRRVDRFATQWQLPRDAGSLDLLERRMRPALTPRRTAQIVATTGPVAALFAWSSFSDSRALRFVGVLTLTCAVALLAVVGTMRAARRDAEVSPSLPQHVTRSVALTAGDVLGRLNCLLLTACFVISATGCLVAALAGGPSMALCLGLALTAVVLGAVAAGVLRVIASRPTVADSSATLEVDLALRRQRAAAVPLLGLYAAMMPSFTVGGLGEPSVTRIAAITTLAGTACYLVLVLRGAGRR